MHDLIVHPNTPAQTIDRVVVQLAMGGPRELWLEYMVAPAGGLLLPEEASPNRVNELWKSTCFELFVQPVGSNRYFEFNFSPSFEWAAYDFTGYRSARQDMPSTNPEIAITSSGEYFFLAVEALGELPSTALRVGLSAVIEEKSGNKSYWALAHPPGKPDFHHPDSFTCELP